MSALYDRLQMLPLKSRTFLVVTMGELDCTAHANLRKVVSVTFRNLGNDTVVIDDCDRLATGESKAYTTQWPYFMDQMIKYRFEAAPVASSQSLCITVQDI